LNTKQAILNTALKTITTESKAIAHLATLLDDDFAASVALILKAKGGGVVTGIGKSAIIASKIVATLNSTGTPSVFMHAADAIHGDLGLIQKDDVVICISKSGNTPEIKVLVPLIKNANNSMIALTGNKDSFLAQNCDYVINTYVEKEACPLNLAPTTSTTAQLVMGDALAICLLECRDFSSSDFARFHPGGSLGKRLYLKVGDLSSHNEKPSVSPDASIKEVLIEITKNRLGDVAVLKDKVLMGIMTDGDIRRMLEKYNNIDILKAKDIMGRSPRLIDKNELAVNALEIMRKNNITQLLVLDAGEYAGIVHLHDLLKEGII